MRSRVCLFTLLLLASSTSGRAQEIPALFGFRSAARAFDIFARFDAIEGGSVDSRHRKWIDVLNYSHGLSNPVSVASGGGAGASRPQHEPIRFTKWLDASSPKLIGALNEGKAIKNATFEFAWIGANPFVFLKVVLDDVYIISHSLSTTVESAQPAEEVSVVYRRITWTYTPRNANGSPGTPITVSYDAGVNVSTSASLASFKAFTDGDAVVFAWRTLSENGNYGLELQQWGAGAFHRAAYVPGGGWSDRPLEYEVRIRGLDKGIHLFRLALLSLDGAMSFSDEVEVALGVSGGADVVVEAPYPNPFTQRMNVTVAVARPLVAHITLHDLLGREVAVVFEGMLEPGGAAHFAIEPDASLAAGLYALRVETQGSVQTRFVTLLR